MGTNFFVRPNIPKSKLDAIKESITVDNIYNNTIQDLISDIQEIHIGKSSCGWQFLFNHNNEKYYKKTRQSLNDYIQSIINDGGKLVDEYGDEWTLEDFWKLVDSKKDSDTILTRYKKNEQEWLDYKEHPEKYKDQIIQPTQPSPFVLDYLETFEDGLRWCTDTYFR